MFIPGVLPHVLLRRSVTRPRTLGRHQQAGVLPEAGLTALWTWTQRRRRRASGLLLRKHLYLFVPGSGVGGGVCEGAGLILECSTTPLKTPGFLSLWCPGHLLYHRGVIRDCTPFLSNVHLTLLPLGPHSQGTESVEGPGQQGPQLCVLRKRFPTKSAVSHRKPSLRHRGAVVPLLPQVTSAGLRVLKDENDREA